MSSSSKSSSPSKSGASPNISPEVAAEIAHLMRTPGALSEGMQRPGGRGHYDPNQPRVPAGDPKGGQFASKGYRGGTQFAQLGEGNPRDAQAQPFEGQLGLIRADQHLESEMAFEQINSDRRQRKDDSYNFQTGRYRFLSMGPYAREPIPGGTRWVISSTTYAYDDTTGAYATISATPARPIVIQFHYGKLVVTPVNLGIRGR